MKAYLVFSCCLVFLDKVLCQVCSGNTTTNTNKRCVYNCKSYYSPAQICKREPKLACMCRTGYVWETLIGESRCILPKDCTDSDVGGEPTGGENRRKRSPIVNCPLGGCFGDCYITTQGNECVCKCPPGHES
ncbi:hypothetical protein JTE90_017394 [Oedothorax gibbosus]|uniref:TIL domain-containing protein n=1 Tax=Oedothorax gibbosus TaxID=931172 RepID=A0AAV6TV90_9ARAC|nr:hypothetical protein JTE90_017394 [Oedothorax gibbosus]